MLAKNEKKVYSYNEYSIELKYVSTSTRLTILDEQGDPIFSAAHMENKYVTMEELIQFAQKEIERDIIKKTDHQTLAAAIHNSIEKWHDIWHHIDSRSIAQVNQEMQSPCGFCDIFDVCKACPVRTKCNQIMTKIEKASDEFEERGMSEYDVEWVRDVYRDAVDMALQYLHWMQEKFLEYPEFEVDDLLQYECNGTLYIVMDIREEEGNYDLKEYRRSELYTVYFKDAHRDFMKVGHLKL